MQVRDEERGVGSGNTESLVTLVREMSVDMEPEAESGLISE